MANSEEHQIIVSLKDYATTEINKINSLFQSLTKQTKNIQNALNKNTETLKTLSDVFSRPLKSISEFNNSIKVTSDALSFLGVSSSQGLELLANNILANERVILRFASGVGKITNLFNSLNRFIKLANSDLSTLFTNLNGVRNELKRFSDLAIPIQIVGKSINNIKTAINNIKLLNFTNLYYQLERLFKLLKGSETSIRSLNTMSLAFLNLKKALVSINKINLLNFTKLYYQIKRLFELLLSSNVAIANLDKITLAFLNLKNSLSGVNYDKQIKSLIKGFNSLETNGVKAFNSLTVASNRTYFSFFNVSNILRRMLVYFSVRSISNGIKTLMDDVNDFQKATARLVASARLVKGATEETTKAQLEQAKALSKMSTFSVDVITAGISQLNTFKLSTESVKQLGNAYVDAMAGLFGYNATQQDAIRLSNILGKAMTGRADMLTRNGILLSKEQANILKTGTETQRMATLVAILKANYEEFALALEKTPLGQLTNLKNEFKTVKIELTKNLQPALLELYKSFRLLIESDIFNFIGKTVVRAFTIFFDVVTHINLNIVKFSNYLKENKTALNITKVLITSLAVVIGINLLVSLKTVTIFMKNQFRKTLVGLIAPLVRLIATLFGVKLAADMTIPSLLAMNVSLLGLTIPLWGVILLVGFLVSALLLIPDAIQHVKKGFLMLRDVIVNTIVFAINLAISSLNALIKGFNALFRTKIPTINKMDYDWQNKDYNPEKTGKSLFDNIKDKIFKIKTPAPIPELPEMGKGLSDESFDDLMNDVQAIESNTRDLRKTFIDGLQDAFVKGFGEFNKNINVKLDIQPDKNAFIKVVTNAITDEIMNTGDGTYGI